MRRSHSLLHSFKANDHGRDFIAGDVHGHFETLEKLLKKASFQEETDRLFLTGDLIDRGPLSHKVLEWLAKPWLHSVKGNHEQMAIDCVAGIGDPLRHARNGGKWFYERTTEDRRQIAERLALLPIAMEIQLKDGGRAGVIHAEPPGWERGLNWSQSAERLIATEPQMQRDALTQALYSRVRINTQDCRPVKGVKILYAGHSTVPEPLLLGNTIYIDTGCSFPDGSLTLIEMSSGRFFSLSH